MTGAAWQPALGPVTLIVEPCLDLASVSSDEPAVSLTLQFDKQRCILCCNTGPKSPRHMVGQPSDVDTTRWSR